jgi:HAMP domain-containing protein
MPRDTTSALASTRFGRRLLRRFLSTALLPSAAIGIVGIMAYADRVQSDAQEDLNRAARQARVLLLGALQDTVSRLGPGSGTKVTASQLSPVDAARIAAAPLVLLSGRAWFGAADDGPPAASKAQPVYAVQRTTDGTLYAANVGPAVWQRLQELFDDEAAQGCVFGVLDSVPLFCTAPDFAGALHSADWSPRRTLLDSAGASQRTDATAHLLATSPVYLRQAYHADDWLLVVGRTRESVYGPLRSLAVTMTLLVALTGVIAFLLTQRTVREQTVPLSTLATAARQLGEGHLGDPIVVESSDEFHLVGAAFEDMRLSLHRQFGVLDALTHIDQAALMATDPRDVVATALDRLLGITGSTTVALALYPAQPSDDVTVWYRRSDTTAAGGPTGDGVMALITNGTTAQQTGGRTTASFDGVTHRVLAAEGLAPAAGEPADPSPGVLVWPLRRGAEAIGEITLVFADPHLNLTQRMDAVGQLVDRLTIGLTSVTSRDDLAQLSRGSIQALARAVDAASEWTAGHSERVTTLAGQLGVEMGLEACDLQRLERGSLLHDVGKVGIPATILDKQGALTPEEWRLMKLHPVIGERILSPIATLHDILPLVRSHHERLDGTGYPDGLVGDAIHPLARILAVADVFDALHSDRPYRAGLPVDLVVQRIAADAGTHFDPAVVAALRSLHAAGVLSPAAGDRQPSTESLFPSVSPLRPSSTDAAPQQERVTAGAVA